MLHIDKLEEALASRDKLQDAVEVALRKISEVGEAKKHLFIRLYFQRRMNFPDEPSMLSVEAVEATGELQNFELMMNYKATEQIAIMMNFMSIPEEKFITYTKEIDNIIKSADIALHSINNVLFRDEYETSPGTFVYQ